LTRILRGVERTRGIFAQPFEVAGQELSLTSSIGVAQYPNDGDDAETLMHRALLSASHAKHRGGNKHQAYHRDLDAQYLARLRLENDLRKAIENQELRLYYQPKVKGGSWEVTGVEALMRWQHPELGMLAPDRFIPIAEETGLIVSLGSWAINEALRQLAEWEKHGLGDIRVAVNVSSLQLRSGALIEIVRSASKASGIEIGRLVLELTESMLVGQQLQTTSLLQDLKQMGLKLAIDDFGTGYSSLSYLKSLPLDELKIDRSFVTDLVPGNREAAIVGAIVSLAHGLGLKVVAEGVETPLQAHALQDMGCDEMQGYLFCRPTSPEALPALLLQSSPRSRLMGQNG
jgi:EAL domain-containing protein (putative c-di-GMP-specific phosphodiesterase class I)